MDIRGEVREFVLNHFYVPAEQELSDDGSLLTQGIVDSTGVLDVITFVESRYGITVDDSEVVPENLDSIGRIAAYVERKLSSVEKPAA